MTKICQKCGKKLPLFASDVLCRDCKIARDAVLARVEADLSAKLYKAEEEIVATKDVTEQQLELLKTQDKKSLLKFYSKVYDQFLSDKELNNAEIKALSKIQEALNLTNDDVKFDERVRPYIYVNSIKIEGILPTVNLQIEGGSPVVLKKGEVVHFADNAILKELKSVSLGYKGGSRGISFRIVPGVYYRVGAHRGHIVKEDRFVETSRGVLLITNQRLFLHPLSEHKPISLPLKRFYLIIASITELKYIKRAEKKATFLL